MKQRYTYEIATNGASGEWQRVAFRDERFSRDARGVARALLEDWILDHPAELSGGERIRVLGAGDEGVPAGLMPKLRVRVYRGGVRGHEPEPAAVSYLGHDERDFPSPESSSGVSRWQRLRETAGRVAADRRVEAGVGGLLALVLGYAASRKLRGRQGRRSGKPGSGRRRPR